MIGGIIGGVLALVLIVAVIAVIVVWRKRRTHKDSSAHVHDAQFDAAVLKPQPTRTSEYGTIDMNQIVYSTAIGMSE